MFNVGSLNINVFDMFTRKLSKNANLVSVTQFQLDFASFLNII